MCPNINKSAKITLNYFTDKKRNLNNRNEAKMEGCNSAIECGVENDTGGIEWADKCPFHNKTLNEIKRMI